MLFRSFMFFSSLPFGMGEEDMRKWIGDENWQKSDTLTQAYKYWCALHEPKGVIPFPFGCSDAQWGGWYKREPKNIQDFKNWKIRCGGGAARILMEHLGAKWSKIPQHDILSAMASDTLDWVEWISAGEDTKMGLHFLGDKYHLHDESWHEPFSMLELLVNKTAFDALDTELKSCFYISLNWVQAESANLVKLGNERAREKHISGNTKIKTFKFKQELREDLRKETLHVLDSVIAADSIKNPIIKDIYKSYKKNCTNCELFR